MYRLLSHLTAYLCLDFTFYITHDKNISRVTIFSLTKPIFQLD